VLREMKRIVHATGGKLETAEGLAGLGDLVAAGTSDLSFNYRVGRSIAEGIADEKVKSEGLSTLKEIRHVVKLEDYPLAQLLEKLIYHYGQPTELKTLLEQ
jgi:glycerol-3-phosphate dehydrogenase (NAD(P)+)